MSSHRLSLLIVAATALTMTPARLSAETNYCALVTPQEAATELHAATTVPKGDKVPASMPSSPLKFQNCTFTTPGAISNTLRLSFEIAPSASVAHQNLQGQKEIFSATGKVSGVSGVGDEAFWNPGGQLIFFCKRAVCVSIQGGGESNQVQGHPGQTPCVRNEPGHEAAIARPTLSRSN
jgi:hypothetical protein